MSLSRSTGASSSSSSLSSSSNTLFTPSPATPPVTDSGWYDLVWNRRAELMDRCYETLVQLQRVSENWKDSIPVIANFVVSMQKKIKQLQSMQAENASSVWGDFFVQLNGCIEDVQTFTAILSSKKSYSTPQIIVALIERMRKWPDLIKAFNNLELDLIASGLFSSCSGEMGSVSLKNLLLADQYEKIEKSIGWIEENLGAKFASLAQTLQDPILMVASELNSLLCQSYLMLDKFSTQMGLNLEALVTEALFVIEMPATKPREESAASASSSLVNTKPAYSERHLSFHAIALRFTELYLECLKTAKYSRIEEHYPFPHAVLAQRKTYPEKLALQQKYDKENESTCWEKTKIQCRNIIQVQIDLLQETKSKFNYNEYYATELQELAPRLPDTIEGLEEIISTTIQNENKEAVSSALKKIRASYQDTHSRIIIRAKWFSTQQNNINELLRKAEQNAKNSNIPEGFYPPVMKDFTQKQVPVLINNIQQLCTIMMKAGTQPSNGSVFDNVLYVIKQCEIKLQEVMDPGIYAEFFAPTEISEFVFEITCSSNPSGRVVQSEIFPQVSWIYQLAQLLKKLTVTAQDAKNLQTKSTAEDKSNFIPGFHFTKAVDQLNALLESMFKLVEQLHELIKNPVVRALPSIGALFAGMTNTLQSVLYNNMISPLSYHPILQAWSDRNNHIHPRDKLEGGIQECRRIFLALLAKSDREDVVKETCEKILFHADKLLDNYYQSTSMLSFLFNNPRKIYDFLGEIASAFATILTLVGDQVLVAAAELNIVSRNLFLLFDKLEIQFYLKENYFVNLISVGNNLTLFALVKLFSDTLTASGYIFEPIDSPPYVDAIIKQRIQLLKEVPQNDNHTKRFIENRIEKTQQNAIERQQLLTSAKNSELKFEVIKKLNRERSRLLEELEASYLKSETQLATAKTIRFFIAEVEKSPTIKTAFAASPIYKKMLSQGRVGNILKPFLQSRTKADVLKHISLHIKSLQSEKTNCYCRFFCSNTIPEKISALKALRNWLYLPGFHIYDALKELREHNLESYKVLYANEKSLLNPLREIEMFVSDTDIGKKIIGSTAPTAAREIEIGGANHSISLERISRNRNDELREPLLARGAAGIIP